MILNVALIFSTVHASTSISLRILCMMTERIMSSTKRWATMRQIISSFNTDVQNSPLSRLSPVATASANLDLRSGKMFPGWKKKSSFHLYQAKERIRIWPNYIWTKLHGVLLFGLNTAGQCKHQSIVTKFINLLLSFDQSSIIMHQIARYILCPNSLET